MTIAKLAQQAVPSRAKLTSPPKRSLPLHQRRPSRALIDRLAAAIGAARGVSVDDLLSTGVRRRAVAHARWQIWASLYADGYGYAPIAHAFGCDHTSVMHAIRRLGAAAC